ncbi:MAG TPA: rhomboid family intramembrane serine protease [Opitutaceae bacterium]|nr:rhomboid family intramembrane serine protease [Opitutaceae bacterium]
MRTLSPAVIGLLAVNGAVFLLTALVPSWNMRMIEAFAVWFPRNEHAAVWQVVTYMFLHGGLTHVLFNMFGLASFGPLLERQWGTGRFLFFYFLCGIGAALTHLGVTEIEFQSAQTRLSELGLTAPAIDTMLNTGRYEGPRSDPTLRAAVIDLYRLYATPMIGASGAIYGILVAFGVLYPNARLSLFLIPVPVAAKFVIPAILLLDLFSGLTGFSLFGGGIAHFAHIGGALIGFLLMLLWRKRTPPDFEPSI